MPTGHSSQRKRVFYKWQKPPYTGSVPETEAQGLFDGRKQPDGSIDSSEERMESAPVPESAVRILFHAKFASKTKRRENR